MVDDRETGMVRGALFQSYSRRDVLRRAAVLGLGIPMVSALLAACGDDDDDDDGEPTSVSAGGAATEAEEEPTEAEDDESGAEGEETEAEAGETEAEEEPTEADEEPTVPVVLEGSRINVLSATYFVPAGQDLFEEQLQEWAGQNGVDATVDFVNWPDLQPKIGAGVQGGAGPDIVELWPAWPYLYAESMVDVNDLAMQIGEAQGGYYDWAAATASVDGQYYSIPIGNSTGAFAYRISYFDEAGVDVQNNFPRTWEELFEAGKALKEMGKPIGQALGHSLGDPPGFCYSYMWAYGAMEVEEDGTTVAFETDEFIEGMRLFVQAWKDAFDETGLSWDDGTNNRAYLSDQISCTLNGSSIYLAAQKDVPDIAEDTDHAPFFEGPAGLWNSLGSRSYGIMGYSENQDAAKAFLEWWYQPEQFVPWLEAQEGYHLPAVPTLTENPIYTTDPKLAAYLEVTKHGRNIGYAGPANQKAAEASSRYIIVDTFAKAVQDNDPEGAIKWGAEQLRSIYGG